MRRERKSIKPRFPTCTISRDVFGPHLRISFEIIRRRRRSTLSYAAARARRTGIMLTMPLRFALRRQRRHIFCFLFRAARGPRWRPMIVEKGKWHRRWTCGKGWSRNEGMRRLLENCSHNSSRDRYYYRTRWSVSVASRLQLREMHLNSIQPSDIEMVWCTMVVQMLTMILRDFRRQSRTAGATMFYRFLLCDVCPLITGRWSSWYRSNFAAVNFSWSFFSSSLFIDEKASFIYLSKMGLNDWW